nr:MAG TPA: hypothetical protein [Bacteriophage sp.]
MPGGLTGRKNWEHSLLYMGEIGLPFAVHFHRNKTIRY